MTTTQITGLGWKRGVEDRYPGTNDSSLSWGTYNKTTSGDFLSGMVVGFQAGTGNVVKKAENEAFHGIMFTENSKDLDESLGGAPPTVIVGGATLFVRKTALNPLATYAAGNYLTSGTGTNANGLSLAGRLVPEGGSPVAAARVGRVQEVHPDGILMRLYPPTA